MLQESGSLQKHGRYTVIQTNFLHSQLRAWQHRARQRQPQQSLGHSHISGHRLVLGEEHNLGAYVEFVDCIRHLTQVKPTAHVSEVINGTIPGDSGAT